MLVQALLTPLPQLLHPGTAAGLMVDQPLDITHPLSARLLVIAIHGAQGLQHITAFRRKISRHFHVVPATMRQTVSQDHGEPLRYVASERITHLDRRR